MSTEDRATAPLEGVELTAGALHAHLLQRRRSTLEHDIKNVVHGLLSGTELLAKALNAGSARITPAECLALLQQQLGRAQTTLTRMLEEVAPSDMEPSEVELAELIAECTHALRHQLQPLVLQTSVEGAAKVRVHAARCKDVLMWVLLDCVDHAPPRSQLELATASDGDRAVVRIRHAVKDGTSSGLATSVPFGELLTATQFQFAVTTSGGERNLKLSLPRVAEAKAAARQGTVVIIVDGNRDAADSLAMLTQLEGFEAVPAYDMDSTLAAVTARMPAAVLVDLDGSIDDVSMLRKLRTEAPRAQLIGLSYSLRTGGDADAYLGKPLDVRALRRLLNIQS